MNILTDYVPNTSYSTALLQNYYHLTQNVVLPEKQPNLSAEEQELSKDIAVQITANFASLGYSLHAKDVQALTECSQADLLSFYKTYFDTFKNELGTRATKAKIFYPGFPQQVMEKSRLEIVFDQLIYALSCFEIQPNINSKEVKAIHKEIPFLKKHEHYITTVSAEQLRTNHMLEESMCQCFQTIKPLTEQQYIYLNTALTDHSFVNAFKQYIKSNHPKLLNEIPNHENRALIAAMFNGKEFQKKRLQILTTPKDILRYAYVVSTKRVSLPEQDTLTIIRHAARAEHAIKCQLTHSQRTQTVNMLEAVSKTLTPETVRDQIYNDKEQWKKLFRSIHIGEYSKQCPNINKVAYYVRNNMNNLDKYNTQLEMAIAQKELIKAVDLAANQPGILFRRADKLLRIAEEVQNITINDQTVPAVDYVLNTMEKTATQAGISPVIAVSNTLMKRNIDETKRTVIYNKNGVQHIQDISSKNRQAFQPQTIEKISDFAQKIKSPEKLAERFHNKELGKMYISPQMQNYTMPLDTRDISSGIETFGRGSAIDLETEHDTKRFFIHWTNLTQNPEMPVDIDLSATVLLDNGDVQMVSWDENYQYGGIVFSGDIRDGGNPNGPGAAEYIDLNMPQLKEQGVKYVIMQTHSYTKETFDQQPNTYFGWMERDQADLNEHFVPSSVSNRIHLNSKCTAELSVIVDVQHDKVIWMDMPMKGLVASQSLEETAQLIQNAMDNTLTIDVIAEANAIANDGTVEEIEDAEIALITRQEYEQLSDEKKEAIKEKQIKIIRPSDLLALTALLLADGPKQSRNRELEAYIEGHDVTKKRKTHQIELER